ncbi:MAG: hypothetical protein F4Y01_09370 [Gammaproteobacteria bacterium]|nr:hypothetical protein [Gammaproteobacteria bacterium]
MQSIHPKPFVATAFVALALLVGGCKAQQAPAPEPEPPAVVAEPPAEPAPPFDQTQVAQTLWLAEAALEADRLLTPESNSAAYWYREVLDLAPDHPQALRGLERVVERYIVLARRAMDSERWSSARTMLDRASVVDAKHPGIDPLRQQVDLLSRAERLTLALTAEEVRSRAPVARRKLENFGNNARLPRSRVSIRAGSDADARWMYQQLALAPGERRIRAGIDIGLPPLVTVTILPNQENGR